MEIPRIWRETETRVKFGGIFKEIENKTTGKVDTYFKYPGGEIPVVNIFDFAERLLRKGFEEKVVEEITKLFFTVTPEASIPAGEVFYSQLQEIGSEVGK